MWFESMMCCGFFSCFLFLFFFIGVLFFFFCVFFFVVFFLVRLVYAGVQHILRCVFVLFCLSSSYIWCYLMLQVSLDCQFLIQHFCLSNVYLGYQIQIIMVIYRFSFSCPWVTIFLHSRELNEWLTFLI